MAAAFTLKLGGLDLSSYLRVNPDDPNPVDPLSAHFVEPAWADTPFSDGQVLISTTVQNREQSWPLFLVDPTHGKDQLHDLIILIQNATAVRPLVLEWRDSGASASTFFDVAFVRFEPSFNYRRSVHGYAAGVLHVFTTGYGHTGTTRITATAAGTGIFLSVPIASVAGDAPALLDTTVKAGAVVPSLGRIVAIAPITSPSYPARIPAASLTDLQTNAVLTGASGADGSQYLALPVAPTGGASGIACMVPLANPTIAGGDNRVLAVVKSGIDAGIGIWALDPFGNSMGATAIASNSAGYALVDLGVCRLPTLGFPTLPKVEIHAGAIWASGAVPLILASPAGLAINEVFCLPDKNLTLLYERGAGGGVLSKDGFTANGVPLLGLNDSLGQPWSAAYNHAHSGTGPGGSFPTGGAPLELVFGQVSSFTNQIGQTATIALLDADHLAPVLSDSMVVSAKVAFGSPGVGVEEARLFKDVRPSQFVQARLAASGFMALECATGGVAGNLLASVAVATFTAFAKYRLGLQVQGPKAFVTLSKDDGGPVFVPASAAFASIGVASNAAVAGAGAPAFALAVPSNGTGGNPPPAITNLYSWEVDGIPNSNILPYDAYRVDGPNADSYRTSSAGVFAGQKLNAVARGAFPKMVPSTTSLAVICAPVDQGAANDLISAVVSVRERFTYGQ
jgi:hypothetical protein